MSRSDQRFACLENDETTELLRSILLSIHQELEHEPTNQANRYVRNGDNCNTDPSSHDESGNSDVAEPNREINPNYVPEYSPDDQLEALSLASTGLIRRSIPPLRKNTAKLRNMMSLIKSILPWTTAD